FQIDAVAPELRQSDAVARLVGIERCTWGPAYEKLPALEKKQLAQIVDPGVEQTDNGTYKYLSQALKESQTGETVQNKEGPAGREVEGDEPISLVKASVGLTLKPFPGHHPILTLGKNATDLSPALFRVHHSSITCEGLEFLIRPDRPEFKAQSLASLAGAG